jgi:hypothetical protein
MDYYPHGIGDVSYDPFYADKHYGAIAFEPISSSIHASPSWQSSNSPITLAKVKEYLRCEDSADDSLLESLLTAAVTYVQEVTGVVFVTSSIINRYSGFPSQSQSLSITPELIYGATLDSMNLTLKYPSKATGNVVTLSLQSGDFTYVVLNKHAILLPPASGWPVDDFDTESPRGVSLQADVAPPTPSYATGWHQLVVAVQMLVGHWYANREAVSDARLAEVPMGVQMLLQNQTSHRGMF